MPDFELVSLEEARFRTIPGRQGRLLAEYARYIQQLPPGQAGKLRAVEQEKPATIRRRLAGTAKALGTSLTIKRAGQDIYFWREDREEEEPRPRRGRPRRQQEETIAPKQPMIEPAFPAPNSPDEIGPRIEPEL